MEKANENKLLLLIKIVPITIILIFTFVNITLSIQQNEQEYQNTITTLHTDLMNKAKQRAKDKVLDIYELIKFKKSTTEEELKESIKQRVYEAYTILTRIYNENKTKNKNEIIKMMQDALRDIRFNNGRGYYFLYKMTGEVMLLPTAPNLESKNLWNLQDAKGVYTIQGLHNIVKGKGEGFYSWYWYKPGDKTTQYQKIGFGKYFEPLNCFIGTGEYIKDFEEDLKQQVLKRINVTNYGKSGYIFIYKYDGLTLAHIKKELLETNRYNVQDKHGYYKIQGIINGAKEGGKFIQYVDSIRSETGKSAQKISYVKGFDEWEWALGTGVYLDDIDSLIHKRVSEIKNINKNEIKRIILINIILSIIFIVIAFVLANRIQKVFLQYKQQMKENYSIIHEKSKNASMGEMIGNIAHQWRQPLSVISSGATGMLLQKQFNTLEDEQFEKTCKAINDNAQYLSTTIDDFKNFIKNEREFKKFNLSQNIDTFLNLVNPSFKRHNFNLVLNLDDTIEFSGYPNELIQCFMNIFNNAKDALKESNIEQKYIFISTYTHKDKIVIEFKDNAGGIPEEIINRVFEPYFTTKHQSQGTGLGLSMTYSLITKGMKGIITVENKTYVYEGNSFKGAEFKILLDN